MAADKTFRGNASQFFVAGELCRRGYYAVVTLGNAANTDILCSNVAGTKFVHIQVKTYLPGNKTCSVGQKAEKEYQDNFFLGTGWYSRSISGCRVRVLCDPRCRYVTRDQGNASTLARYARKGRPASQGHNSKNNIYPTGIKPIFMGHQPLQKCLAPHRREAGRIKPKNLHRAQIQK